MSNVLARGTYPVQTKADQNTQASLSLHKRQHNCEDQKQNISNMVCLHVSHACYVLCVVVCACVWCCMWLWLCLLCFLVTVRLLLVVPVVVLVVVLLFVAAVVVVGFLLLVSSCWLLVVGCANVLMCRAKSRSGGRSAAASDFEKNTKNEEHMQNTRLVIFHACAE